MCYAAMILVTGATGFVGRRLIRLLVETYGASSILCLVYDQTDSELERTGRAILDELKIRYISVDLVSGRGLECLPKTVTMVFHLASNTDTGAADHSINDVGTRNLLEAIQPLPPKVHFIFTSSIAVADHRVNPHRPVDEETPLLRPFNDYGRKKLAAEEYLRESSRKYGFQVTIVRLCAVYGRGTRIDGLFDRLSCMVSRDSLFARLNYPGKLSLVNVDDVSRILVLLSQRPSTPGACELFIPVSEVMTISELIRCYYEAYGLEYRAIRFPMLSWKFCDMAAKLFYRMEPLFPHIINNRVWQLGLVVGNNFYNESGKIFQIFPELRMKRFREVVGEMIR
jgi:nucleoside-diphosphate-sugar epimerase